MGLLQKYTRKRHFDETPEPPAGEAPQGRHRLKFVVQEHHARALHYDFRLELDGVLKSWAVPKGPSLDPHEQHLAVQTEDHPYDYRKFEGVIPEGNYGAGKVIIWDEGWYEPRADAGDDPEKLLRRELRKGHLTFILHGKKLQGEFALIKMERPGEKDNWLLIKKGDEFATTADVTTEDTSVKSNKRVDELGDSVPDTAKYPKKAAPKTVKPMLCTLVTESFDREGWLFEIKWDGYRAIGTRDGGAVTLISRNQQDLAKRFASVTEALHDLKHQVVLDGEIVVTDQHGVAHFEWLQQWTKTELGSLQYYVFDILWCDGRDVRAMSLEERKVLLKHVLPADHAVLRYSDHIADKGEALFATARKRGLEGIVAKKADSTYHEGLRGPDWLKIKTHMRQEVVIGGFTEPRGSRKYLGSLLVGVYEKGIFTYVGHSGGGIADEDRKQLAERLTRLERATSPFTVEPKPNAPVHWVRPELVCEMEFTEWTHDGSMRHPEYKGLRNDKSPNEVHKERPKKAAFEKGAASDNVAGLRFEPTHLNKVFFPKHKDTKGDLFTYYKAVAPFILPYLKDRPLSLNRMPDGIRGPSFFQKNNEHLPDWVPHADIFSDSTNANLRWIVGGDLNTLLYIVQLGSIEVNPWNARIGHLNKPDWIVIDLDPEGIGFRSVIDVALTVKAVCDEWRIPAYPKTSGKTGIHIYIPMQAKYTFEQGRNLAHLIALEVNKRQPKITSVERKPEKRRNKIYLDYLQNREGQTLAAPYSVRPTPDATVSTPLHWDEVNHRLDPKKFTIKNTTARLKRVGDLWKPVTLKGLVLADVLKRIDGDK